MKKKCYGCQVEMEECYKWQQKGYDAGLDFGETWECEDKHCMVFVLDKEGNFILW